MIRCVIHLCRLHRHVGAAGSLQMHASPFLSTPGRGARGFASDSVAAPSLDTGGLCPPASRDWTARHCRSDRWRCGVVAFRGAHAPLPASDRPAPAAAACRPLPQPPGPWGGGITSAPLPGPAEGPERIPRPGDFLGWLAAGLTALVACASSAHSPSRQGWRRRGPRSGPPIGPVRHRLMPHRLAP